MTCTICQTSTEVVPLKVDGKESSACLDCLSKCTDDDWTHIWLPPGSPASRLRRFNDYDIEVPQFALDLGFIDQSWHNDAAAHMSKGRLHLWISEVDPNEREFPQAPRFTLQLSGDEEGLSDNPEDLLQTDSEEEIIKLVRHLEAQDAGTI